MNGAITHYPDPSSGNNHRVKYLGLTVCYVREKVSLFICKIYSIYNQRQTQQFLSLFRTVRLPGWNSNSYWVLFCADIPRLLCRWVGCTWTQENSFLCFKIIFLYISLSFYILLLCLWFVSFHFPCTTAHIRPHAMK